MTTTQKIRDVEYLRAVKWNLMVASAKLILLNEPKYGGLTVCLDLFAELLDEHLEQKEKELT